MPIHLPVERKCSYLPNETTGRTKWNPDNRKILSINQLTYDVAYLYFYPNSKNLNIEFLYGASIVTKDIIHESLTHSFINKQLWSANPLPGTVLA